MYGGRKSIIYLFVDFSKAFDLVVHDNLWFKLLSIGINGKMIIIIRSMYNCIKTKVFTSGIKSDVFYSTLGVRQGECLSPFLFSMYINDMESYLASPNAGITIGHIRLLLLLYADDVVIFANSPQELQTEMHKLFLYCEKWKLKLNTTKSKVVIFKRRAPNVAHGWIFGDAEISTTGPTHAKLVSLTSPCCSGWPAPMNTLKANRFRIGMLLTARRLETLQG